MLKNQNSIDLNPFNSRYDEVLIRASETATVLPGALVEFRDELNDNYRGGYITKKYNEGVATNPYTVVEEKVTDNITVLYKGTSLEQVKHETTYTTEKKEYTLDNFNIDKFAPAVVLENSLIGHSLNHKNKQDNVSRCRRLVPGDKFLLRAVADSYVFGDPLYAIQTDNGIYVTKEEGGMFIGWSEEEYTITEDMVDVVDTYEFPDDKGSLRGKLVNLLAVRIGVAHKVFVLPNIEGLSFETPDTAPNAYTGNTYTASDFVDITGTETGDEITYVIENLSTGTVVSSIKGSGEYKITVTIKREGYKPTKEIRYVTIEKKQLSISGTTVEDKFYDGTNNAVVNLGTVTGIQDGDDFELIATGKFDNADIGDNKTVTVVYTVPLTYAGNYLAPATETLTADIKEVERTELTISSVQIADKTYDGTTTANATVNIGNTNGANVQVVCVANYNSAEAGDNKTVYLTGFEVTGADKNLFKLPETLPTTATGNIQKALLTITGSYVDSYAYDGLTDIRSKVQIGNVDGIIANAPVVNVVVNTATLDNANVGQHTLTVIYGLEGGGQNNYYVNDDTLTVTIIPATITGIELTSANITSGEQSNISITGTEVGDTVVYIYDGTEYNEPPTINETGEVTVGVRVSRANYNDWTGTTTFEVTEVEKLDYTLLADGSSSPAITTTRLTMRFEENPGTIANDSVVITGDAVLVDDEDYVPVRIGGYYMVNIPIRRIGNTTNGTDTVTLSIINNENVTETPKQTPTYLVMAYWGIYPCQFGDTKAPSATQILEMENNNGMVSGIPTFIHPTTNATTNGLACDFVLSENDWNKEIEENNADSKPDEFDEEDLNFNTGCGYEFLLYLWDNINGIDVINATNVLQNGLYKSFTVEINGLQYTGLVSKSCARPSSASASSSSTFYFIFK